MIISCPFHRIHEVIPIGKRFFDYAKEHGTPNPTAFMNFWIKQYEADNGAILIDVDKEDNITGFCGLILGVEPWTGAKNMTEVCWYSEGINGVRLLKEAFKMQERCGAQVLYLHHLHNDESPRMQKFYEKLGCELKYYRYTRVLGG